MQIRRVPITHPDARVLVDAVQQVYTERYGGPDETPVDPAEFEGDAGAFFVGYVEGRPVATGAWRRREVPAYAGVPTAEIKRMYVAADHQRRGLARQVLAHLEADAAAAGCEAMVLETGTLQPEAIALYTSAAYAPIEPYGYYRCAPESVYLGRRLRCPR